MPRRLGPLLIGENKEKLEELCERSSLNDYEKEILYWTRSGNDRIYHKRQSLNYIADTMEFDKYGKDQRRYSVRTINNMHKEAFKKIIMR